MQEKGFRIGWVFISYCMIAGGLIATTVSFQAIGLTSEVGAYAACFLGAALGGFFAGRASEGKTIVEPAVGGLAVVVSFILMISMVAGLRSLVALKSEKILLPLLGLSAVMAAGGLVGAGIGERTSTEPRSESGLRWAGITALIVLGLFFMAFLFGALLLLRGKGSHITADDAGTVTLLALSAAAFFGCFAAQAVAPRRMVWAIGFGFMVAMTPLAAWAGAEGNGNAMVGLLILGGLGILVGALGALLGWKLIGEKYTRQSTDQVASTFD